MPMFITVRTSVSPGEEFFSFLEKNSDTPMIYAPDESSVFSKVFSERGALEEFLSESGAHVIIPDEVTQAFSEGAVALLFSDERSGSSVLEPASVRAEGGVASIEIVRHRGLTMDMAYTFIFVGLPAGTGKAGLARITTDMSAEAVFF